MDGLHLNAHAFRAVVDALDAQHQAVALEAQMTRSAFSNHYHGTRWGTDEDTRIRLAAALSTVGQIEVHVRAITCHCPDKTSHRSKR